MTAAEVAAAAAAALGTPVERARPVPGGDLNDAFALDLRDGRRAFVKTAPHVVAGAYKAEAAGLRWLADAGALAVPEVLAVRETLLVLAWVERGRLDATGEEELGRGLAALHAAGAPAHGATAPGAPPGLRLGPLLLPSGPVASWSACYAGQRLMPVLRAAADRGALPAGAQRAVARVCARLDELAGPPEPPARLHGDLWSGNILADARRRPVLIDPAAYGGHREVDLAMLALFGTPSRRTLAAYAEAYPLADGHADRVSLWQLFPLLVHAALFGGGYGARAAAVAGRWA